MTPRRCEWCGVIFRSARKARLCSKRCRNGHYSRLRRRAAGERDILSPWPCRVCSRSFLAKSPTQVYCGANCRDHDLAVRRLNLARRAALVRAGWDRETELARRADWFGLAHVADWQ